MSYMLSFIKAQLMSSPTPLSQAVLEQEARIAGFKSEVQKSQELHHSSLTRDTERLQTMLDKVKAEIRWAALCLYISYTCAATVLFALDMQLMLLCCLPGGPHFGGGQGAALALQRVCSPLKCCMYCRYEIDKLTASQRLDLNLEKGSMRDELQALRDKANELEIKMDKETNSLKAAVEQTKNETIKYCLGMMLAFTTAGLGAARLVSK